MARGERRQPHALLRRLLVPRVSRGRAELRAAGLLRAGGHVVSRHATAARLHLHDPVAEGERPARVASAALDRVLAHIRQVAPTPATVLLLGETGTGKEVMAQTI